MADANCWKMGYVNKAIGHLGTHEVLKTHEVE